MIFYRHIIALLLMTIAWGALIFSLSLGGGFLFDDHGNIVTNKVLHIESLGIDALGAALTGPAAGPSGRPVSMLSLAVNYYFFGLDPFAFKVVNLVIHLANGLLVFFLGLQLFSAPSADKRRAEAVIPAIFLAAAWLIHPLQLTPIAHVVQRMTSLSAFFLLIAFIFHIAGRRCQGLKGTLLISVAWLVFWPLSVFSKESGALFPLFVAAWELTVGRAHFGKLDRFAKLLAAAVGVVLLAGLLYLVFPSGQWLWDGYQVRTFTPLERLMTEGRVLWFYIELSLFPRFERLGLYHDDISISSTLLSPPETLFAAVGILGLAGASWQLRTRFPLISLGIAWFLIGHSLESSIVPLEIAHEHRNYLPLLGVMMLPATALATVMRSRGDLNVLAFASCGALLLYLSFVSALRAHQFGDDLRRTQIEAQHHRNSPRAQYEAGSFLSALSDAMVQGSVSHTLATGHLLIAGQLEPSFKPSWVQLIILNCRAGVQVDRSWVDELKMRLNAMPFTPGDRSVMYQIKEGAIDGSFCLESEDIEQVFASVLSNPNLSPAIASVIFSWYADYLWLAKKDLVRAQHTLARSLKIVPGNLSNQLKWSQLLLLDGDIPSARNILEALPLSRLSVEERKTVTDLLRDLGE